MEIHPQAIVSPAAELGNDVKIGPFCIIEENTVIGDRCEIDARVSIKSGTTLGCDNKIHEGAVLGDVAQHLKQSDRPGELMIGSNNIIREFVTIHRSLEAGTATIVGDHNFLMGSTHIAHDCLVGNHTIFANAVLLAGHVTIEDRAYLSGYVGVHQFCRVGKLSIVGGTAVVLKDVPPFVTVDGQSNCIAGLNKVGLRRAGCSVAEIKQLKEAYRLIYRSELTWSEILEQLKTDYPVGPASEYYEFFQGGQRGFTPARKLPTGATIKLRTDTIPTDLQRRVG